MPFDLEKSNGTFTASKFTPNIKEILIKLGDPPEFLEKLYTEPSTIDLKVLSEKTFTYALTMRGRETVVNTYTIGEESDEKGISGAQQGKARYTMEGDDLVAVHTNYDGTGGVARRTYRWIDDNTLLQEFEVDGMVGSFQVKKV